MKKFIRTKSLLLPYLETNFPPWNLATCSLWSLKVENETPGQRGHLLLWNLPCSSMWLPYSLWSTWSTANMFGSILSCVQPHLVQNLNHCYLLPHFPLTRREASWRSPGGSRSSWSPSSLSSPSPSPASLSSPTWSYQLVEPSTMEELGRRSSLSRLVVFSVSPSATSLVAFSPSSFPVP